MRRSILPAIARAAAPVISPGVRLVIAAAFVVVALSAAGCGEDDPANVAGNFTVAVTNGENGCNFMDWQSGNTAANIPVVVTQDGANATATVTGIAGIFLTSRLGNNVFQGEVGSSSMRLTLFGTRSATQGSCSFTVNATMKADIDGDVLTGWIEYTTATNGSPDCGTLAGCKSVQAFNGTRPPTP